MIKIKLEPSFHNFSSITLDDASLEYEIHPLLKSLRGLDQKERLRVAEYKELKALKSFNLEAEKEHFLEKKKIPESLLFHKDRIEELICQIIEKPEKDDRLIADGISVSCVINKSNSEESHISFHSPESNTREFEIMKNLFSLLHACFMDGLVLNHLELMQDYFGIGKNWKITNEHPLTLRLFGRLSIYEKEEITTLFDSLPLDKHLILDLRNLDGMGGTFHESFQTLINKMKGVYWWIENKEKEYFNRHFSEMNIPKENIFIDYVAIMERVKAEKM